MTLIALGDPHLVDTRQIIFESQANIRRLCASVASSEEAIRQSLVLIADHVGTVLSSGQLPSQPLPAWKREFDNWRTAVKIVQHLRAAGYGCELSDGEQMRH